MSIDTYITRTEDEVISKELLIVLGGGLFEARVKYEDDKFHHVVIQEPNRTPAFSKYITNKHDLVALRDVCTAAIKEIERQE